MTQESEHTEKKVVKRGGKRRVLLFSLAAVFLILAGLDACWEIGGIPDWMVHRIERRFAKAGYQVHADCIRFGIIKGGRFTNLSAEDISCGIRLSTPELTADWKPLRIFTGVLFPFELEIRQGRAWIPLLPEAGEEGKTDGIAVHDLSAVLVGERGQIRVRTLSGRLGSANGFLFTAQGTINQLLHHILFRKIQHLNEQLTYGKIRDEIPENPVTFFPLSFRQKLLYLFRFLERQKVAPEGTLFFHLDMADFLNCTGTAKLYVPKVRYGDLEIQEISETVTLHRGIFRLEKMLIDLENGSSFLAEGTYEDSGRSVKGTLEGRCRMKELLALLSPELRREAESQIQFGDELITLQGKVDSFSLSSQQVNAAVSLVLPDSIWRGVPLKNLHLSLTVTNQTLGIALKSAELCHGGTLAGECMIEGNACSGKLSGSAHPEDFQKLLPEEASSFLKKNAVFPEKGISFSGTFATSDMGKKDLSGTFSVLLNSMVLKGQPIHDIQTTLHFTPEKIQLNRMSARMENGTRFSGELSCDLLKDQIFARVVCSGIPDRMIPALDAICGQPYLAELTQDIRWPESGDIIVADTDFFADISSKPFYSLSGTLVMRDFSYGNIPFRYGAVRYLLDSTGRVLLPSVILETNDGTVNIRAFSENLCKDTVDFSLKSTISGNDLIRLCVPDWKGEIIDFPFSVSLETSGVINTPDEDHSRIHVNVLNGTCLWAGVKVSDLDTQIEYQNQILSFQNAEGTIAGGRCRADYHYDFKTEKGSTVLQVENAKLAQLLREFPFLDLSTDSEDGRFSTTGNINFEYKGDDLLLYGKGQMVFSGKELWNIPVLGTFLRYVGSVWPMVDSSAITEIICDCEFKGDVCRITQIKSDGGIISLSGDGTYRWDTGEYDCTFRAELLKNALPFDAVSTILSPVSWFLSKNLKGKLDPAAKEKK